MRIIAVVRWERKTDEEAIDLLKEAFSKHSLVECTDPTESSAVMEVLVADMAERDHYRFLRTVKFVASHVLDGTVASVSVLNNHEMLLRFRNPSLRDLIRVGHIVLNDRNCSPGWHFGLRGRAGCESRYG